MTIESACPLPLGSDAPDDDTLVDVLARARTVAVVGASPNPERTSHRIALWLMDHTDYEIYLVNPAAGDTEIRGHAFYSSLDEVPVDVDIVDVFRRSEHVPPVVDEAIAVGAPVVWMQLGVRHPEAAHKAAAAGATVVQNRCLKVEYARLADRIAAATA
ncbi:CoA-binding protein [Demequina capsici]|uniref:CoA-binding protein n=1 Tax=Demequina capsici TaxID=3075620 RepID=A0AA96FBS6_9MICO|nr:CoA-binding protein [Demequina sp. PMTSA13]WNM26455.1 CoA-binding protein [Demequina sp. PMTSA13]